MHPFTYFLALAAAYCRGWRTPPAPSEHSAALEGAWLDNVVQLYRETGCEAKDRSAG